jgi:hypothetical protein
MSDAERSSSATAAGHAGRLQQSRAISSEASDYQRGGGSLRRRCGGDEP